jgi:hypothetical protein
MVLLSVKSEFEMLAELASINRPLKIQEKSLSFTLNDKFTKKHIIKLAVEDKKRQFALFFTQSEMIVSVCLIDSVTVLKMVADGDDNLS